MRILFCPARPPLSYQLGGYTLILPREQVQEIDMSMEDGIRFALTAGINGRKATSTDAEQRAVPRS